MQSTIEQIPSGDSGTAYTISKIIEIVDKYSVDMRVIQAARRLTTNCAERDKKGEADALFCYVRDNIKFVNDPLEADLLQSPIVTMSERCGDCDDKVILLATLNKAIGNPVAYVTIALQHETSFSHIFLIVFDRITCEPIIYDPSLKIEIDYSPDQFGRYRIWYDEKNYQDLSGFFSKIIKNIKQIGRRIDDVIISPIVKEAKRVARRVKDEMGRFYERVNKEFARWEEDLGPFGKFLVVGAKFGFTFVGGPIGTALTYSTDAPWAMYEEEWVALGEIALAAGSTILTTVTAGGTAPLLAAVVLNLAKAGMTAYDLTEEIEKRKKIMKQLREAKAKISMEERVQREAIAKLEKDVAILQELQTMQAEIEAQAEQIMIAHQERIEVLNYETKLEVLNYESLKNQELKDLELEYLQEIALSCQEYAKEKLEQTMLYISNEESEEITLNVKTAEETSNSIMAESTKIMQEINETILNEVAKNVSS